MPAPASLQQLAQLMALNQRMRHAHPPIQLPTAQYTPAQVAPTDVIDAVNNYQNAANTAYGDQAALYGSNVGGLSGLASMLAMSQLYGGS